MLRIQELRKEKGLSQKGLAEKVASTNKNIWAYENNVAIPPLDILIKLADFFGCSIDYLCGRADDFGNVAVRGESLNQDETTILQTFRALNKQEKTQVTEFAHYLFQRKHK
ncbi:MAG: helix-turn-helix transcriptional regulator [Clostridia bacterium]|nr:helix-turn-helix transcriptional regulator [Clostridia bacterium]